MNKFHVIDAEGSILGTFPALRAAYTWLRTQSDEGLRVRTNYAVDVTV